MIKKVSSQKDEDFTTKDIQKYLETLNIGCPQHQAPLKSICLAKECSQSVPLCDTCEQAHLKHKPKMSFIKYMQKLSSAPVTEYAGFKQNFQT